ncbi:hypothetical protein [Microcoleus sp. F4-D5]
MIDLHRTDMAIALFPSAFIPVHLPSSAVKKRAIAPYPKKCDRPF